MKNFIHRDMKDKKTFYRVNNSKDLDRKLLKVL